MLVGCKQECLDKTWRPKALVFDLGHPCEIYSHREVSRTVSDEGRYLTTKCWWRDIKCVWEIMTHGFPHNSLFVGQWNSIAVVQQHTQPLLLLVESTILPFSKTSILYKVNITTKPQEVNRNWNAIKCLWGDFKALILPASLLIWAWRKPATTCLHLQSCSLLYI